MRFHWKRLIRIALASVICFGSVRVAAQPGCEPQPTQAQQPVQTPQPPQPEKSPVQLIVECVVDDNHECVENSREQLGHHLKVRVTNLKDWTSQGNSPWNLILFLNERPLKGLRPVSVNPQTGELIFKLVCTAEAAPTWDDLMARGKNWKWDGVSRKARPSVGLDGGLASQSKASFEIVFLSAVWLLVCLAFALCTLVTLILLACKTALLKDAAQGPFSLSRTQMAIWTWVLLNGYFFLFVMTWNPGVDIPVSMLGLLGISATTYVAAALVDQASGAAVPQKSKGFWRDIAGGDVVSLHRIQMIGWTVVLVFVFVVRVLTRLNIPDFNPTLLGLLGLSAGTYVGFKFPENQKAPSQSPATPQP